MGRRRVNRRRNLSRAGSDITLNEGDASSDAESNTSGTVQDVQIRDSPILSDHVHMAQGNNLPTSNRFTPIEDDAEASEPRADTNQNHNRFVFPRPPNRVPEAEFTLQNPGNGDEQLTRRRSQSRESTQANTFESILKQQNMQTRAMINECVTECMTGTANLIRESMKECMMGFANMSKNNLQDLLFEVRGNNNHTTRPQLSNPPSSTPQVNASYQLSELGNQRPIMTSCIHPGPSVVTSLASLQTDSLPQNTITTTTASVPRNHNHSNALHSESTNSFDSVNMSSRLNASGTNSLQPQTNSPNSLSQDFCPKSQSVRLPPFTGNSNESWKVWHSRFTTVANLNRWDETTKLSELTQRMQGTAAEFVFDEIPIDILSSYSSLVDELDSRFKSVETNRTFKVQFSKRLQKYNESAEEYAAELKRIYDKAYPGRNPEMRRQLLLQQFLNGLKDKEAKFAVEYYKEPNSIEEAVHHVVTFLEAQQGQKSQNRHNSQRKTLRFEDDDNDDDEYDYDCKTCDRARSLILSDAQTLRKVNDTPTKNCNDSKTGSGSLDSEMLQKILTLVENTNRSSNQGYDKKGQKGQGQANTPLSYQRQNNNGQGQAQVNPMSNNAFRSNSGTRQGQGQANGQGRSHTQGQGYHAALQCYHCYEIGHIKRNCPILKAEQSQSQPIQGNRNPRPAPLTPYYGPSHGSANYIDLN